MPIKKVKTNYRCATDNTVRQDPKKACPTCHKVSRCIASPVTKQTIR